MKQHINLSSHSKALTDLIQSIDQIGTQRTLRDSIHASHSTLPIVILPSLSQESLLSSARDVSHQTTKTLMRRRCQRSRFSLYTRKSETTPQATCNFGQWDQMYIDAINNDEQFQALDSLVHIMALIVEQDNIRLLIRVFRLASLTLIYFKEYGKALIFLKNCIFLSQFPRDFETIQWALLQLGLVCKMLQKYEIGKVFMKKVEQYNIQAVEFAWFTEDLDKELNCYEELGKLCFMNYELQLAKQLHDMSMAGRIRSDEIMKISRQGLEQLIRNYPSQQFTIDQQILSKIIDFPFIIRAAYELRPIQNKYLSKHFLECVPTKRLYPNIEESLNKILQDHHFFFEIPMPIENPHTVEKTLTRKERIKSTQMLTWIKLAIQKEKTFKTPIRIVPPSVENRKLSLDQAVTERLGERIQESQEIFKNIQCVKQKNVECIRLTGERNRENSKQELLKLARECLQC